MKRATKIRLACLIILVCSVFAYVHATPTIYYVGLNGSDSNNGTSKTTPWLHAPGMANCTATCDSTTINAGDSIILRGGDMWGESTGTVGLPWDWNFSGSSGNVIYIGVDKTWFTGASWTRPVLSGNNATSTSLVSSCTHNDSSVDAFDFGANNYVTLDDLEFTGFCYSSSVNELIDWGSGGTNETVSHNYFHGWTMTSSGGDGQNGIIDSGNISGANDNTVFAYNVIDGSDSYCTGANACSGGGIYTDCAYAYGNYFKNVANGFVVQNMVALHDSTFINMYESFDDTVHSNIAEWIYGVSTVYVYDLLMHDTDEGVGIWPNANTEYFFNITAYNIGNGANCIMPDAINTTFTAYVTNVTFDDSCIVRLSTDSGTTTATTYWQNNHFIGYSPATLASVYNCDRGTCTQHDNGNEVYQTVAVANGQGYNTSNNYAPTSGSNSTVGAGGNLTSSCTTYSSDSALCSGTSGGVTEGAGKVATYPAITIVARPSSGAWNSGAYQYSSSPPPTPAPPIVQSILLSRNMIPREP